MSLIHFTRSGRVTLCGLPTAALLLTHANTDCPACAAVAAGQIFPLPARARAA